MAWTRRCALRLRPSPPHEDRRPTPSSRRMRTPHPTTRTCPRWLSPGQRRAPLGAPAYNPGAIPMRSSGTVRTDWDTLPPCQPLPVAAQRLGPGAPCTRSPGRGGVFRASMEPGVAVALRWSLEWDPDEERIPRPQPCPGGQQPGQILPSEGARQFVLKSRHVVAPIIVGGLISACRACGARRPHPAFVLRASRNPAPGKRPRPARTRSGVAGRRPGCDGQAARQELDHGGDARRSVPARRRDDVQRNRQHRPAKQRRRRPSASSFLSGRPPRADHPGSMRTTQSRARSATVSCSRKVSYQLRVISSAWWAWATNGSWCAAGEWRHRAGGSARR